MKSPLISCVAVAAATLGIAALWCVPDRFEGRRSQQEMARQRGRVVAVKLVATESNEYPPGRLGEVVRLGEELVKTTSKHPLTKPFVGNQLNCTSCHLDAGTNPVAASFVGAAAAYPAFSPERTKSLRWKTAF